MLSSQRTPEKSKLACTCLSIVVQLHRAVRSAPESCHESSCGVLPIEQTLVKRKDAQVEVRCLLSQSTGA